MKIEKLNVLDLFCGLKSLKQPCEDFGMNYFGVDFCEKFNPELLTNIMYLNYQDIPFGPDIIWASPPCEHFSVASIGKYWNKDHTPKTAEAKDSIELVLKTIEIIKFFNPKYYFIENPRGKLRKLEIMNFAPIRQTVTYCQYGDFRMKPTDIWTNNISWIPKPVCHKGDACHIRAPRGSSTGTQGKLGKEIKSKVPYNLLFEILNSCLL